MSGKSTALKNGSRVMLSDESMRLSESLTNAEFIEVYRTLDALQEKLSHDEFHFVRYLLKMALLELDSHGKAATGKEAKAGVQGETGQADTR